MTANSTFGYAKTDDGIYLGYRVDGDGSIDIVSQSTGRATSTWNGGIPSRAVGCASCVRSPG